MRGRSHYPLFISEETGWHSSKIHEQGHTASQAGTQEGQHVSGALVHNQSAQSLLSMASSPWN